MTAPSAKDHEQQLIDYLIETGEAVEYGESWTPETTHEWWIDTAGERHCRLVQTYHGGGSRGDDDQAEYARRLLDLGRAVMHVDHLDTSTLPPEVTHVVHEPLSGGPPRAERFRRYNPPPEGNQR